MEKCAVRGFISGGMVIGHASGFRALFIAHRATGQMVFLCIVSFVRVSVGIVAAGSRCYPLGFFVVFKIVQPNGFVVQPNGFLRLIR